MKLPLSLCSIWLTLLTVSQVRAGGGWTLEQGALRTELSATFLAYDQLWQGSDPFLRLQRPVTDLGIYLMASYGLRDDLTLFGSMSWRMLETGSEVAGSPDFSDTLEAGSMSYLGNPRLGLRYRLIQRKASVFSLQLTAESNSGDLNLFNGLQTGFDAWSLEPLLAFGHSFRRSYLAGHGGIAFRTNGYSEEFLGQLEYGYRLGGQWWAAGLVDYRLSFRNGEAPACNTRHTGLYVNNQEAISYGFKLFGPLAGQWGITAGIYGALYADNLPAAFSFNGGLTWSPRFSGRRQSPQPLD